MTITLRWYTISIVLSMAWAVLSPSFHVGDRALELLCNYMALLVGVEAIWLVALALKLYDVSKRQ